LSHSFSIPLSIILYSVTLPLLLFPVLFIPLICLSLLFFFFIPLLLVLPLLSVPKLSPHMSIPPNYPELHYPYLCHVYLYYPLSRLFLSSYPSFSLSLSLLFLFPILTLPPPKFFLHLYSSRIISSSIISTFNYHPSVTYLSLIPPLYYTSSVFPLSIILPASILPCNISIFIQFLILFRFILLRVPSQHDYHRNKPFFG
jgi:hypothetical protein